MIFLEQLLLDAELVLGLVELLGFLLELGLVFDDELLLLLVEVFIVEGLLLLFAELL